MDTIRRLQPHRAMLLVVLLLLVCLLTTALVAVFRPRSFNSYPDAIGYQLDRHAVEFARVQMNRSWPDNVNTDHYMANVAVQLQDLRQVWGRMECRTADGKGCWVSFQELGIVREPIPDLTPPEQWSWRGWLQRLLPGISL